MHFSGTVIHGKKLGRTIGFPTANIVLPENPKIQPATYLCQCQIDSRIYVCVGAYLQDTQCLELHILDFSGDLYEQTIPVTIIAKIRENKKFISLDDLKEQIQRDVLFARASILS